MTQTTEDPQQTATPATPGRPGVAPTRRRAIGGALGLGLAGVLAGTARAAAPGPASVPGPAGAPGPEAVAAPSGSGADPAELARIWRVAPTDLPGSSAGPWDPAWGAGGALDGMRVAVKDLYALAGQRVGAGNPAYLAEAPVEPYSAWAVENLAAAGARPEGIAHTDEFAYSLAGRNQAYGTPPNGLDPRRIPGGSSSGSASAVAAGLAEIGLGTDTGGSIRVPSSYQGLFGLRTTHGLIPRDGLLPLAPSYDTVGWMARDADAMLAATRSLAASATGAASDDAPIRRVLVDRALMAEAEPEVAEALLRELDAARRAGAVVLEEVSTGLERRLDDWAEAFRVTQAAEAWRAWGEWVLAHAGSLSDTGRQRFASAWGILPAQEDEALGVVEQARRAIRDVVPARACLAVPAAATVAPLLEATSDQEQEAREATMRLTCLGGLSGLPIAVAPLLTGQGNGAGLGLMGSAGDDVALVAAAGECSRAFGAPARS
ncbi:amidase family protein [Rothia halotolerans]|uniref:amidase family protein n=1 Tax=Rothia halotolerans TaxID=405770 RepID=UPI00101BBB5D|nr:amidase family protein [Rothia halotolerans]